MTRNLKFYSFVLLLFFASISFAQESANILAEYEFSECNETMYTIPRIQEETRMGDTTYLHLYASANCGGIREIRAEIHNDTVIFSMKEGKLEHRNRSMYWVNGEEFDARSYRELISVDSTILYDSVHTTTVEIVSKTTCDCCYHFYFKLLQLEPNCTYTYLFDGKKAILEDNYSHPEAHLTKIGSTYFFRQPKEEISIKLYEIWKNSLIQNERTNYSFYFEIRVNVSNGNIVSVQRPEWSSNQSPLDDEYIEYIKSLSPILVQKHPTNNSLQSRYLIKFGLDDDRKKILMGVEY